MLKKFPSGIMDITKNSITILIRAKVQGSSL